MAGIWLITGAQASGKSTVAELLASRVDRGVHVRGGQFYRWVVNGWTHVGSPDEAEVRRLLDLRYRLSATVADEYAAAGFDVVVQDNIYGDDVVRWIDSLGARPCRVIVLRPSAAVIEARNAARRAATGKVAYRDGFTAAINDEHVASTPRDTGLWLDTSEMTVEETVDAILDRSG